MINKRHILAALAAACLAAPFAASADGLGLGIAATGSPHNFTDDLYGTDKPGGQTALNELGSSGGWNGRNEICRVCHAPHDHENAAKRYLNGLLWNHEVSTATYTMYDSTWSSTLDNAQDAQPTGVAKLCLGCHDGTVGIDTFDKYAGGTTLALMDGGSSVGYTVSTFTDGANIDLRGTHPLSITYDESVDTNLQPKTNAMGTSGTIADVLDGGKVQCSSCHDVHDSAGEAVAGTHLLRVAQTGANPSGLCLTCHKK